MSAFTSTAVHLRNVIASVLYLTNISTAVFCMFLLIPFQDVLSLKTCLASSGSRGSVSGGKTESPSFYFLLEIFGNIS